MAQKQSAFFTSVGNDKKKGKFLNREKFTQKCEDDSVGEPSQEKVKKPFDKKTYRLKKYSNKYKLEQWEDQRKKKLLRNYFKEVKNNPPTGSYKPVNLDETEPSPGRYVRHPDLIDEVDSKKIPQDTEQDKKTVKKDAFWKAKAEFARLKKSKEEKKAEIDRSKKEREEKLQEYRKKKAERFKKLSKKTKKGQPIMTGRLELLLEKIEKNK